MGTSARIALVTGAGGGIGRAIALRLAADGCDIGVCDLDPQGAGQTAALVRELGRRACVAVGDVGRRDSIRRAIDGVVQALGPVGVLVNNAGILRTARFVDVTERDWRDILSVNLDGVFHCTQLVLPAMLAARSGCIVNMSSWTGKRGAPNHGAYSASKAAVIALTQSIAGEVAEQGVRINAVCPGTIVDTQMRAEAEAMNRAAGTGRRRDAGAHHRADAPRRPAGRRGGRGVVPGLRRRRLHDRAGDQHHRRPVDELSRRASNRAAAATAPRTPLAAGPWQTAPEANRMTATPTSSDRRDFDAVVVGAGFAGLYMLYRLRELGLVRRASSRPATASAAPGTGTAIRARAATSRACSIPTPSRRSCSRNGTGASAIRSRRRSCATSTMWPTASTCAPTSGSTPASSPPPTTRPRSAGTSAPTAATRSRRAS